MSDKDVKNETTNVLRRTRTEAGLTLQQLAEKSGLAKETLSRLENNRRKPTFETLSKIAQALDLPVSELSDGLMEQSRVEVFVGDIIYDTRIAEGPFYEGERLNFRGRKIARRKDQGGDATLTLYECPNGYRVHVDTPESIFLSPSRKNPDTGEKEYDTYATPEELVEAFSIFRSHVNLEPVRYLD
jgi:transcriptional regulator with XRE-family HTH domain